MNKKSVFSMLALASVAAPSVSMADASANFGWVSEYVFRGIIQDTSSASAGIDYEADSGFYIGTWGADVGDGLETDLYFGYGGGNDDFSWSVGYTGYYYTDDFDDTYNEINLGIAYGIFSLDVALGEWDGFGTPQDYTFTSITISPEKGPYFTYGDFSNDFTGDYLEMGYGFDFMGVDLSIAALFSDTLPVGGTNGSTGLPAEWNLVFGISKTLGIGN